MKEHVIVSISTVEGSHHYQLGKWRRRFLKGLGYFAFVAVVLVSAIIYHLVVAVDLSKLKHNELENQSKALSAELSDLKVLRLELENDLSEREERLLSVSDRLGDLEKVLGVVDPDAELESRLDAAAITSSVRTYILTQIPSGSPVGEKRISSGYGYRTHPQTGKRKLHRGLDYAVDIGSPIYASADGVIEVVRPSNKGSGNFIRVQHAYGFSSSYSHLNKFAVKAGEVVQKGQLIGYSGNSGLSTGPHLHYEIRFVGRPLNPRPFVDWGLDNFESIFEKERGIRWDSLVKMVTLRISNQLQLSSQKVVTSQENSE